MPIPVTVTVLLLQACSTAPAEELPRDGDREDHVLAALDDPAEAAGSHEAVQALLGSYRHAGGNAEQQALERAVDGVVEQMNLLSREIARKRLLETNKIPSSFEIATNGDHVTISFDDRSYTGTVGGPAVEVVGVTGDTLRMTLRTRDKKLVQHFDGPKGDRTNTMRTHDGKLRMSVVVESESLPSKLVYDLTFKRRGS